MLVPFQDSRKSFPLAVRLNSKLHGQNQTHYTTVKLLSVSVLLAGSIAESAPNMTNGSQNEVSQESSMLLHNKLNTKY